MKKSKKKKIILILIGVFIGIPLLVVFGFIMFFIGSILCDKFFNVPKEPQIRHAEFPFELIYKYNGVEYTLTDNVICDYGGIKYSLDDGNFRAWSCEYEDKENNGFYYIDKENNPRLYIHVPINARYYMGEEDALDPGMPYIEFDYVPVADREEEDSVENVDFEILEWNRTEPVKNVFE